MAHQEEDVVHQHKRGDDGFSMVEVVVALMIFGLLAGTVASALGHLLQKTKDDQSRALAANLATRVIDRLHAVPAGQLPNGVQVPQTFTSDGHQFTVQTATEPVAEGAGAATSACESVGALSARRISAVVTWSGMGSTKPVRSDTLRRLSVSELEPTRGVITTKIVDRDGLPLAGQIVRLTPGTLTYTTGVNGCAVFSGLTPGSYAVTLGTPGFVDPSGSPTPTRAVTASAGLVTRDTGFSYDRAARLAVTWPTTSAYPVPAGTGVLLGHSAYSASGTIRSHPSCPATPRCASSTGSGVVVEGLFPSLEGYRTWLGACADARSSTSPAAVVLQPGTTTTTAVPVQVDIQVTRKRRTVYPVSVVVVHDSDAGCPDGSSVIVPISPADGSGSLALPAGRWSFAIPADSTDPTPDPPDMKTQDTKVLATGSSPTLVTLDV